ncbi:MULTISPECIES: hypothetical protein [Shewanella]|uniref:hypothetical protein n=1 Tax=Shewanella TaxID=22 RepID=UPI000686A5D4|nr:MULTISPECIES: hypothetical protein [Shewanella]QLE86741.1 hypothetical protein FLM48_17695 [Shewanella sp. Scap07]
MARNITNLTLWGAVITQLLMPCAMAATIELTRYDGGYQGDLNDEKALMFVFSSNNQHFQCHVTTTEKYLRQAQHRLENINLSEPNFYFDCQSDEQHYMLSNRYRTYAEVIIKQPDSQFPMSMHIEAKLVNLDGDFAYVRSGDIALTR